MFTSGIQLVLIPEFYVVSQVSSQRRTVERGPQSTNPPHSRFFSLSLSLQFKVDIEPGQFVAFCGQSGCGKSSALQLLERFYDVLGGKITIDGHDLRDLNLKSFRKSVAMVSQEPILYDGTIAFNLQMGDYDDDDPEKITEEQMIAACRDANIWEFVSSLPLGLGTEVGGRGASLSGGQKREF